MGERDESRRYDVTPEQAARLLRDLDARAHGRPRTEYISVDVEADGALERAAVEEAAHALGRVHDGLSMVFGRTAGALWQAPSEHDPVVVTWDEADLAAREPRYFWAGESDAWPDLDRRPVSVNCSVTDEGRTVVNLAVDHLLADGFSADLLVSDFIDLYSASVHGRVDDEVQSLRRRPGSDYLSYLEWWGAASRDGLFDRQLDHWRDALDASRPLGEVALDFVHHLPGSSDRTPVSASSKLAPGLVERLREAARKSGVTFNTVLLCGIARACSRHADSDDLALVLASARRTSPRTRNLVAWLSTLVIHSFDRGRLHDQGSLDHVWDVVRGAVRFGDVSYHEVKKALRPGDFGKIRDYPWVFVSIEQPAPLPTSDVVSYRRLESSPAGAFAGLSISITVSGEDVELDLLARATDVEADALARLTDEIEGELAVLASPARDLP